MIMNQATSGIRVVSAFGLEEVSIFMSLLPYLFIIIIITITFIDYYPPKAPKM